MGKLISRLLDKYNEIGMAENKLVDAVTCAVGIKSIYDFKTMLARQRGEDMEAAEREAVMDATLLYNATQQSSHPAFLSPMQVGRGVLDRSLSVFQNCSLGFARQFASGLQDLTGSAGFIPATTRGRLRPGSAGPLAGERGLSSPRPRGRALPGAHGARVLYPRLPGNPGTKDTCVCSVSRQSRV